MQMPRNNSVGQADSNRCYQDLLELGNCHVSVGNYPQAHGCYEKAASLEPDAPDPYVGLGVIALQNNLLDDAEIAFKVACRLDKKCAGAYAGLAVSAQQKCDYERAFDMYLKCLDLDIDNLAALLGLFQTSCRMGSFEKVTYYLEVYLDMHPNDPSVIFSLAVLYMKDGRLERAQKVLTDLLAHDPANKDAVNLLEEVQHRLARTARSVPKGVQAL